jgi:hypothetical protein
MTITSNCLKSSDSEAGGGGGFERPRRDKRPRVRREARCDRSIAHSGAIIIAKRSRTLRRGKYVIFAWILPVINGGVITPQRRARDRLSAAIRQLGLLSIIPHPLRSHADTDTDTLTKLELTVSRGGLQHCGDVLRPLWLLMAEFE